MCACSHQKNAHSFNNEVCLVNDCNCKNYVCAGCGEYTAHGLQKDGTWDVCFRMMSAA